MTALPQSDKEWLALDGFDAIDIPTGIGIIKGVLVRPAFPKDRMLTIMFGGIPRAAERDEAIFLVGKYYGELARILRTNGSSALLFLLPGVGESVGRVTDYTMRDRIDCTKEVVLWGKGVTSARGVNLISTSMGGYIALRTAYEMILQNAPIHQIFLLSPAAYPSDIETLRMGEPFRKCASSGWSFDDTVIAENIDAFLAHGGAVHYYAYEIDDPPIPIKIQRYYEKLVDIAAQHGYPVSRNTIWGVKHSFRRMDTDLSVTVTDDEVIRRTAKEMGDLILSDK